MIITQKVSVIILFVLSHLTFAQTATVTINTEPFALVYLRSPFGDIIDSVSANNLGTAVFNNITSVDDQLVPNTFYLSQNYPNPFNNRSSFDVALSQSGIIDVEVYNIIGQQILSHKGTIKNAGNYKFDFAVGNIAPQVLFYKVNFNGKTVVNKMNYLGGNITPFIKLNGKTANINIPQNNNLAGANYTFISVKTGKAAVNKTVWIDGDKTIEMPLSDGITVTGIARGVDSDPLNEIYPLENATVSLDGAVVNTANDGRYWIGGYKFVGAGEILTISHPNHHNRTEIVKMGADTTMTSNILFNVNEDLEFFTYIFQRAPDDPGLRKPDPARGDTLSVFVGEPDYDGPAIPIFEENIVQVANEEVPFSNGSNYFLEFTSDSSNAFVEIIYNKNIGATGYIQTKTEDPNDPTKITKINLYFKSNVPGIEDAIRETVLKEMINLYNGRDIFDSNVPEQWKESLYYQAGGGPPASTEVPEKDRQSHTLAAKIGKLDIVYMKNVE